MIDDKKQLVLQSELSRGDSENRERCKQQEIIELRAELANSLKDKQHIMDSSHRKDQLIKQNLCQLEEKENMIRQLQTEVRTILLPRAPIIVCQLIRRCRHFLSVFFTKNSSCSARNQLAATWNKR